MNCNKIFDQVYEKLLKDSGETILFTGGDTPKFNKRLMRYSIFWEKPEYTDFRGAFAFGMNKTYNSNYVSSKGIPWSDPMCGGYDTDCLIPGAVLRKIWESEKPNGPGVTKRFPIILAYLTERVRWGIIERGDALKKVSNLDMSDPFSYNEFRKITQG